MADLVSNGIYRWDSSFKKKLNDPKSSKYVEQQIGESTIQGYKKFSDKEEIKFTLDSPKLDFRLKKKKEKVIDGNSEKVEEITDLAERRADITSGGYDTHGNSMTKDKELTEPEKQYQKSMEAEANNMNYSSQSGNFQGGWNRVNALEKQDFSKEQKAMKLDNKKPAFKLVKREGDKNRF